MAIIAAFAISEILAGWGRSLLASPDARYSSLQFLASLFLLFETLRYIWTLWYFRSIEWPFWNFVLALLPMLFVAVAAHVISMPRRRDEGGPPAVYFARARRFFPLQLGITCSWTLYDLVNLSVFRRSLPDEFNATVFIFRGFGIAAWILLARTKRASYHWAVLTLALVTLVYYSFRALPVLGAGVFEP